MVQSQILTPTSTGVYMLNPDINSKWIRDLHTTDNFGVKCSEHVSLILLSGRLTIFPCTIGIVLSTQLIEIWILEDVYKCYRLLRCCYPIYLKAI